MNDRPAIDLDRHPLVFWEGPLGLPDFGAVRDEDFSSAFDAAFARHRAEIDTIATNPAEPSIDNTLVALELSGEPLSRVSALFWCKAGADTNETIQAVEREVAPKMSRHFSAIHMDARLFARIEHLVERREALDLDSETRRVLDKIRRRFVRAGALLGPEEKARLAAIGEELAGLGARFGQNVLADERDWALFLEPADIADLPGFLVDAMTQAARLRGRDDGHAVTLSRSIAEPFLAFSPRRDLREKVLRAFTARGQNGGETDNAEIVRRTLELRAEKAALLGHPSYAAFKLEDTMARTPEAVGGLLEPVWRKALEKVAGDEAELRRIAASAGANHPIEPWDWRYYAEKLRGERFAFDEAELKPYLQLDRVIEACFDVAGRLFGLEFEERPDIKGWRPEVRVFEVRDAEGARRAVFLADYFARPSKRSGAWMSSLETGHRLGVGASPIIYNVMNFAQPADGEPALLSMDEARTLFHEFGHALHGMLSNAKWPSLAGTSVARDFVELPSQLYEHWLTTPEILGRHALHVKTGQPMPDDLMRRMLEARNFNVGFATVEFTASALVDMAFHAGQPPADPIAFEAQTLERLGMPASIAMRHRTPHFLHVFSGDGYSAGYYSYMWSEVLDADAFAAFEETGDVFDAETAARLKHFIYAAGDTEAPETLYEAFRGRLPSPEAMMAKRGLA